ncbi:carbohydrate ABC transporter substrate-binding protein (CUT1 family) [Rathayibacter sp. PhB185]|nr:carbohydrate ABC transporter substrate-binding protein (CUT1 family) [Rathayibacter sp. PhB186]ROS50746.1 carbohydrate ABC transporter substrate-binding protein (CUT1 family) [Rathayibacter sp. PhB185]
MSRSFISRSRVLLVGLAASALLLAGCSGSGDDAGANPQGTEPVTLRLVWWGSDDRAAVTNAAVDAFEAEHPNITVETESLPFDGYFDKLSTQVAANDAPDVQQLTSDFVIEYGSRGALLDLADVDVTNVDKATTEVTNIDGEQLGVPTGIASIAIVANPTLFAAAGVEMPDDSTWTWKDYEEIAEKISANSPEGTYGSQALGTDSNQLGIWARQNGEQLFTEDGEFGVSTKTIASFYDLTKRMVDEGAAPGADEATEQTGLGLEQTGTALNRYAMGFWASNQLTSLEVVSKSGLKLLRFPSVAGDVKKAELAFGASQYWSAASRTEHPAEAQMLIDYLTNSEEAGKLLLVGRGSPVNSEVRDAVVPLLSEGDAQVVTFISTLAPDVVSTPLSPPGSASFQENMRRYTSEVLFGRMSTTDAAKGLIDETTASLQ